MTRRYCQVGMESTYGGGASSFSAGYVKRASFDFPKEALKEETIEQYLPTTMVGGPVKISGTIEASLRYDTMIGEILMALCGSGGYSVTGSVAPYTHEFLLDEPDTSLEIKIGEMDGNVEWDLVGCGVNTFEMTINSGEIATFSTDFIAQKVSKTSFSAPSYSGISSPLTWIQASIWDDAVEISNVKNASVKVERALDEDMFEIGSVFRTGLGIGGIGSITGSLEFSPSQIAEIQRAFFGSTTGTSISDLNALGNIHLVIKCMTTDGYGVEANLPITFYTSSGTELSGQDKISRKVEYEVVMDDDNVPAFYVYNAVTDYLG